MKELTERKNIMKRILTAILCAGILAVTAVGCSYNDALYKDSNNSSQASEGSTQPTTSSVSDKKYGNNLDGLVDYFVAKQYIDNKDNSVKMDASAIGAAEGKKFAANYSGANITIELYYYNTKATNDTANKIIKSVNDNGTFSIYGLPDVTAYLSDNGNYLMVYTDASIDKTNPDKTKDNYKHREQVIKDFKAFKK